MSGETPQTFQDIIRIIGRGKKLQRDLTREEARIAMHLLLMGEVSPAQIGAFLVTMRVKEETIDELAGFLEAIRQHIRSFVNEPISGLVDLALPYDGKARNLQTGIAAALVLAAADVPVLLHGADNIPTKAGAAVLNTLRALGYPVDLQAEVVWEHVHQYKFGVLNI
ncbi:MAG: anthranilate phosphoribosyltransferase, partial [Chloroflexi bacterium]